MYNELIRKINCRGKPDKIVISRKDWIFLMVEIAKKRDLPIPFGYDEEKRFFFADVEIAVRELMFC